MIQMTVTTPHARQLGQEAVLAHIKSFHFARRFNEIANRRHLFLGE